MNKDLSKILITMENNKKSFSFTKELDGVTKTISGEECENGWIVTVRKEWYE